MLYKMVDGENIVLSAQEESDLRAEWAAYEFISSKEAKEKEIMSAFKAAESVNIGYLGVTYSGGRSSAVSIKESLDLSQLAGLTTVDVYDINMDSYQLTIAEAQTLVLTIAVTVKANIFKRNAKLKLTEAASNKTELDTVAW